MIKFNQFLTEITEPVLYHGTTTYNADSILENKSIVARTNHDSIDVKRRPQRVVSFSRTFKFAAEWARQNTLGWDQVAVLEFDIRKLKMDRYNLIPYDFWAPTPDNHNTKYRRSEAEEYIIGDVVDVKKYIKAIFIFTSLRDIQEDAYMHLAGFKPLYVLNKPGEIIKHRFGVH